MVERNFFELSPIEKSWCGQTRPLVAILNIVLFQGHRTANLGGTRFRILQNTSKNMCAKALASFKQGEFRPFLTYSRPTILFSADLTCYVNEDWTN